MWTDIQWNNMNWETWEFPADETVDQILKETLMKKRKLHPQNARYRDGFRADRFYPYRVNYDMITMIGAPSSTEFVYLSGPDLDLPDGWYPDYIGTGMFRFCADLQGVIVPDYIAGLSTNAFNGAKNNRFYIYFESGTPMELMGWSKRRTVPGFGDDESKIQIMVALGAENDYINAWMYPMAGYANLMRCWRISVRSFPWTAKSRQI